MTHAPAGQEAAPWLRSPYQRELWGCRLALAFPVVKRLDYQEFSY